jgi:hypothetical protein
MTGNAGSAFGIPEELCCEERRRDPSGIQSALDPKVVRGREYSVGTFWPSAMQGEESVEKAIARDVGCFPPSRRCSERVAPCNTFAVTIGAYSCRPGVACLRAQISKHIHSKVHIAQTAFSDGQRG